MATRPIKWINTGTAYCYVHSYFGSDLQGDGTMAKPYRTLQKAYSATNKSICCIGRFTGDMNAGGAINRTIMGDYYGGAVFDGNNQYTIWGWALHNMIVKNIPAIEAYSAYGYPSRLSGAGRAVSSSHPSDVLGVASDFVLLHASSLYYGCIGGTTNVARVIYSKIIPCLSSNVWLGNGWFNPTLRQSTIYGVDVTRRIKCLYGSPVIEDCLFGKFALIVNDTQKFKGCLFSADCTWYWFTGADNTNGYTEITISGTTSAERYQSLVDGVTALGKTMTITFENCIFSAQTSAQLMNNPENLDFTLTPNSDAILKKASSNGELFIGAMPPALSIPIMNDSTEEIGTWDERSIEGCIQIIDNKICVNPNDLASGGKILSKIAQINPAQMQLNGVWSVPTMPFLKKNIKLTGLNTMYDYNSANYVYENTTITQGWYLVRGEITYNGTMDFHNGEVLYVTADNTQFVNVDGGSYLQPIIEPNTEDVLYCRCRRASSVKIKQGTGLQAGATYLNNGGGSITYRTRTIVNGESFVAMNSTDDFYNADADYEISVMFDDARVQSAEWIPARLWGRYFVGKLNGAIMHDDYNVPISSGNYLSWISTANGGYANAIRESIIDMSFVQFALFVKYYN